MEGCSDFDFIKQLGVDISVEIFMHVDDPSVLIRACLVSSSWQQFVIENELCKQLCLRKHPEMSSVTHDIEVNNMIDPAEDGPSSSMGWNILKRNHKVYAILARGLAPILREDCLMKAISASSTDNYPQESIENTLIPNDRVEQRASYWSSKGESDATAPETLIYKLRSDLCVVSEIHVQPFQAYFHYGFPIYSSKAVRFRMGHPKFPLEIENDDIIENLMDIHESYESNIIWTYTSPEFPMSQENCLQQFKLPEPVLCIGGILKVELLGRVQKQEMDDLYYICVAHVRLVGWPLLWPFDAIADQSGKCTLKYCSEGKCRSGVRSPEGEPSTPSARIMQGGAMGWEQMILTAIVDDQDEPDDSDDDLFA